MVLLSGCVKRADFDALTDRVATLEAELPTVKEQIATLQSALETLKTDVDDKLTAVYAKLDEKVEALQDADAVIAANLASLQTTLEGQISELDTRLSGAVNGLTDTTQQLGEDTKKNASDIAGILTSVGAIEGTLAALNDTYATDAELSAEAAKLSAELKAEVDKLTAAIAEAKAELTATLGAEFQEALKGYAELSKVTALEATVEGINTTLAGVNTSVEDLQNQVAALTTKLDAVKGEYEAAIASAIDAAIAEGGKISEAVKTQVAALVKKIEDRVAVVEGNLEALSGKLDAVIARIQSVVFVPEYDDLAATINYATLGNAVIEMRSKLQYQVTPADCAAALAKGAKTFLSFNFKELKTRAADPALEVVSANVIDAAKGIIEIEVDARNLAAGFYKGGVDYAVSLVVNYTDAENKNAAANLASSYVKLYAAENAITVKVVDEGKLAYEIEYTDNANNKEYTKLDIMKANSLKFSYAGNDYTLAQMKANGFDITVTPSATYTSKKSSIFNNVETKTEDHIYSTVNLTKSVVKSDVGTTETVKYTYAINAMGAVATTVDSKVATIEVVKPQRKIDLTFDPIYWNYNEDAVSDVNGKTESVDVPTAEASTVGNDITWTEILANATNVTTTVTVDGKTATGVQAVYGKTSNGGKNLTLKGFAWGKTYTVETKYELEYIDVTVTGSIATVDRGRAPIVVTLPASKATYAYETSYTFDNSLVEGDKDDIYAQLVAAGVFGKEGSKAQYAEAAFLKLLLETKTGDKYALVNTFSADGAAAVNAVFDTNNVLSTGAQLINDATGLNVKFSYKDIAALPKSVKHVYDVTTWYGQKITINKTVNFENPTFDFYEVPNWVKGSSFNFFSTVLTFYDYKNNNISELDSFNTRAVDMESAFRVVTPTGDHLTNFSTDLVPYNISVEFELVPGQEVLSAFTEGPYKLNYKDYDKAQVYVRGKIFQSVLLKDGATTVELNTRFSQGGDLENYSVKPCEVYDAFTTVSKTLYLDNAKTYEISALAMTKLTDARPYAVGEYSFLQYKVGDVVFYDRDEAFAYVDGDINLNISDIKGSVVVGNNDLKNGFAEGRPAFGMGGAYSQFKINTSLVETPALKDLLEMKKLEYKAGSHTLYVHGGAQLDLTSPVDITINVDLVYYEGDQNNPTVEVTLNSQPVIVTLKPLARE